MRAISAYLFQKNFLNKEKTARRRRKRGGSQTKKYFLTTTTCTAEAAESSVDALLFFTIYIHFTLIHAKINVLIGIPLLNDAI